MEVMEARMAQAKANLTLPFFWGSTAAGSAAESIVDDDSLCSLAELVQTSSFLSISGAGELVSMWQ
jgi:hypothetical protein